MSDWRSWVYDELARIETAKKIKCLEERIEKLEEAERKRALEELRLAAEKCKQQLESLK